MNKLVIFLSLLLATSSVQAQQEKSLVDSDLSFLKQGWRTAQKNLSIEGNPLRIGNKKFTHGIGSHAPASLPLAN